MRAAISHFRGRSRSAVSHSGMTPLEPRLDELSIRGDGVALRDFSHADLPLIEEASADPFIPVLTTVPAVYSLAEGEAFVERQVRRRLDGEGWSLAVHDEANDRPVGQIGLWLRNAHKGRAEIGYWVVASARGGGLAGRATTMLSEWAFANLDISRLSLFIEPWNDASIRTAESAGYRREALLHQWERVGGVPKDMYSYVRLPPSEG